MAVKQRGSFLINMSKLRDGKDPIKNIHWLVDWLLDRSIHWLIDWPIDCLIAWSINPLIDWMVDWLLDWCNGIVEWVFGLSIQWSGLLIEEWFDRRAVWLFFCIFIFSGYQTTEFGTAVTISADCKPPSRNPSAAAASAALPPRAATTTPSPPTWPPRWISPCVPVPPPWSPRTPTPPAPTARNPTKTGSISRTGRCRRSSWSSRRRRRGRSERNAGSGRWSRRPPRLTRSTRRKCHPRRPTRRRRRSWATVSARMCRVTISAVPPRRRSPWTAAARFPRFSRYAARRTIEWGKPTPIGTNKGRIINYEWKLHQQMTFNFFRCVDRLLIHKI